MAGVFKFVLLTINLLLMGLLLTIVEGFYSIVNIAISRVLLHFDKMMLNFPLLSKYSPVLILLLFIVLILIRGLRDRSVKSKKQNGKNHPAIPTVYYETVPTSQGEIPMQDRAPYSTFKKDNCARHQADEERKEENSREKNARNRAPTTLKNPFSQLDVFD